jgi:hypothetical protein
MATTVQFRMNGVSYAFLRELGCHPCPQCSAVKPRANTSGSLFVHDWTKRRAVVEHHLLFDCGAGVVDSLIDHGVSGVTQILVSHRHADHLLDLDRLVTCCKRSGQPMPLNCYCTGQTWLEGPMSLFPWLPLRHRAVTPDRPVHFFAAGKEDRALGDLGIGLRVTPVAVWHGTNAREAVVWVVEFGHRDGGSYRKIILGWDLLHLIPRYPGEDADDYYDGPCRDSNVLGADHAGLLQDADELFLDATHWNPRPKTGHTSVAAALRFHVPVLQPRRTWLVHYSGHSDPWGPLDDDDLQGRLDREKRHTAAADCAIVVARHGMTLSWVV